MGRPAGHAPDGEEGGEQLRGQPQAVEQEGGVELDVGVQPPVRLALAQQAQGRDLDRAGELVQLLVPAMAIETLRRRGQHVRSRIAHPVDAVAEAHQPLAPGQLLPQHRLGPLRTADLEDHVQRRAGSATVEGALQGSHGAGDGRDQVRAGGDDHPGGPGPAVGPASLPAAPAGRPGGAGRWPARPPWAGCHSTAAKWSPRTSRGGPAPPRGSRQSAARRPRRRRCSNGSWRPRPLPVPGSWCRSSSFSFLSMFDPHPLIVNLDSPINLWEPGAMNEDRFLTAEDAAAGLQISLATLYAFASPWIL